MLIVDTSTPTQTLYTGLSGVWSYTRQAPQPGAAMTVTARASAGKAPVGSQVSIYGLAVDQYENWVAAGTPMTFTTSAGGSFSGSQTIAVGTASGRAVAVLTSTTWGAATVTVTTGRGSATLVVEFTPLRTYLPLIIMNH